MDYLKVYKKQQDSTDLWLFKLSLDENAVNKYATVLTEAELKRANRFVYPRHRRRFIVARGTLRTILSQYLSCQPTDIEFAYNEFGKPSITQPANAEHLHFNLSHSGESGLLGITWGMEIGVDIECLSSEIESQEIAQRFFTKSESQTIASYVGLEQSRAFFNAWTRKEALLKALGEGLSFSLKDCEVSVAINEPARIHFVKGYPDAEHLWSIHSFTAEDDAVIAVVTLGTCKHWNIQSWEYTMSETLLG